MTPYERMLREKRELKGQKVAEARMMAHTQTKQRISRKAAGMQPASTRPEGKKLPALCRNHPVLTMQPEAVNYMPME
jgi:hypothetical protein